MAAGTKVIAATTTVVIAKNTARSMLILCNASNENIFLGVDAAAVQNSGICLKPLGPPLVLTSKNELSKICSSAINAICASGTKNLSYLEA